MDIVAFAKALGFAAFAITAAGYVGKNDDRLRLAIAIAAGLLSVHYFLMGAWVSGISLAINFVRNQIAVFRKGPIPFLIFAAIQIGLGAALFERTADILPILGSLISGYALFLEKGVRFRALMLACTSLWFANNLSLGSYGAALQDALSALMNSIGIMRIRKGRQAARAG